MTDSPQTSITISFKLNQSDISYFRERLDRARASRPRDEGPVIEGAESLIEDAVASSPPDFIKERIAKLRPLIAMLRDKEWRLEGEDRERILDALSYFADPEDLIPDRIPGIGFLDDAIMIDLVTHGLKPELEAYENFVAHRDQRSGRAGLENVREELQSRMRRRRRRRDRGYSGGGEPKGLFQIF